MALHIALLESLPAPAAGDIARRCAAVDASLHLIGPLSFGAEDPRFLKQGPKDWDTLDWWLHPEWRDFRNAINRERCLYFAKDGLDIATAPFRANSVLIFGDAELGLPERIRGKYPDRIFRIPELPKNAKHKLPEAVSVVLKTATEQLKSGISIPEPTAAKSRRPRRR